MASISVRTVVRIVLVIVAVAVVLYVIWLLRQPLRWIFLAGFLAIALSGPVNFLDRYMRRGIAIATVYLGLLLIPVVLAMVLVPPMVEEANRLAQNLPRYAQQLSDLVQSNPTLRGIEEDYNITQKLEEQASTIPTRVSGAASTLSGVGLGILNSLFAIVTILVLCAFMLGSGPRWVGNAIATRPPDQAERLRRVAARIRTAIANYVAGALLIAVLAGTLAFIVLWILGVPFRGPLALIVALFSLIPLIGATIAAVLVGLVTLFTNFPTATIVWAIWAIVYQQFENHIIQPQVQKRAVDVHPFVVIVAVLFGSSLFGVLGALLAIPIAASIQIAAREYAAYRAEEAGPGPGEELPAAAGAAAPTG